MPHASLIVEIELADQVGTSPARPEVIWQLRQFGIDHLFFGSDFPLYTPEETLHALAEYGFMPDELKKICSENAARVWR